MKNIFSIAFVLLFVSSCQLTSFTERPGVILEGYPKAMHGNYIMIEKSKNKKDTYFLHIDSTGAYLEEPLINTFNRVIDTNSSVSHLGDYYYLNIKEADSSGHFTYYVYPFDFDSKNLYFWSLYNNDKESKRMAKCGLKPSGKKENEYLMDNMPFKVYVEKYLRKKDALHFKRIK